MFAQDLVDPLPRAVLAPLAQVGVDVIPVRQVVGHQAPRDAAAQDVEAAVDDPTGIVLALTAPPVVPHQKRLDQRPFRIAQVRRIGFVRHGSPPASQRATVPNQQGSGPIRRPMAFEPNSRNLLLNPLSDARALNWNRLHAGGGPTNSKLYRAATSMI